ncbi:MAG: preprotein translocase subunit YajC, partial [Proteobacteria bacterium]|nr:preprotein translocase subunit YajC [Pseudomonadota bacterium]
MPGFDILILVAFAAIFYFMLWRPQSKRAKEHRELIEGLS